MNRLAKGIKLTPTANTYISKKNRNGKEKEKRSAHWSREREGKKKQGKKYSTSVRYIPFIVPHGYCRIFSEAPFAVLLQDTANGSTCLRVIISSSSETSRARTLQLRQVSQDKEEIRVFVLPVKFPKPIRQDLYYSEKCTAEFRCFQSLPLSLI